MTELLDLFNQIRRLDIITPQGQAGVLAKESHFVFNYHQSAAADRAVSLVLPIRQQSYYSGELMGVFAMNRPEGYLRYIIEERLKRLGAPSDMFLLYLAGSHQIGRLSYALQGKIAAKATGESLDTLLRTSSAGLFDYLIDKYALTSGISGIQPKALVPLLPQSHSSLPLETVIVKAEGEDYLGIARNEYLCLSVAKEAGFNVPNFWLSEDGLLLVMSRFDRKADGTALGFEDMAVLTGRSTAQKYQGSYDMIAKAVSVFAAENSAIELQYLFERVALSCKLGDGDAHLKNFGLLYENPVEARCLAPIYDVVCTNIYPQLDGQLALKLNKHKKFPTHQALIEYGLRLGLEREVAQDILQRIDAAFEVVCQRLVEDIRYRDDDLMIRIKNAVHQLRT
ncbi:MAG: type II toxin-antitoxin system HipA family toxin [Moraxellaceae bacterium]|nr:type II toxin-antitoxin system HipA family toxin [Moraxellaceae bacterium]